MKRLLPIALIFLSGCTVISYDRVFPKLTWAWTVEAKEQRRQDAKTKQDEKAYLDSQKTNTVSK